MSWISFAKNDPYVNFGQIDLLYVSMIDQREIHRLLPEPVTLWITEQISDRVSFRVESLGPDLFVGNSRGFVPRLLPVFGNSG